MILLRDILTSVLIAGFVVFTSCDEENMVRNQSNQTSTANADRTTTDNTLPIIEEYISQDLSGNTNSDEIDHPGTSGGFVNSSPGNNKESDNYEISSAERHSAMAMTVPAKIRHSKSDSKKDSTSSAMPIYLILLGVVAVSALVISIYSCIKNGTKQNGPKKSPYGTANVQAQLNNLQAQLNKLQKQINGLVTTQDYANINRNFSDINYRLCKLEKAAQKTEIPPAPVTVTEIPPVTQPIVQHGNFGFPARKSETEGYFVSLLEGRTDSDARFKATIYGNIAEFEPIEGEQFFSSIISTAASNLALEFTGCSLNEARKMTRIEKGEARFESNHWIITKKAKVLLQ